MIKNERSLNFTNVDLVALSACETAVGEAQDDRGREVEGLAMVMQNKGAKGILATLWPVADESTSQLMREFYRLREENKLTKAEALREAQLELLHGVKAPEPTLLAMNRHRGADIVDEGKPALGEPPKYQTDPDRPFAHPYYWAPFILMGNGL